MIHEIAKEATMIETIDYTINLVGTRYMDFRNNSKH